MGDNTPRRGESVIIRRRSQCKESIKSGESSVDCQSEAGNSLIRKRKNNRRGFKSALEEMKERDTGGADKLIVCVVCIVCGVSRNVWIEMICNSLKNAD